ncbi:nuclear transport factor 2 family protein [Streptomyces sp. NBC_01476]|uniref:nuclear transport factor 2 family protein n=1 Tax=Streptomyces sp. NBC_01476 TaxID=2903881 RepID=UPI002E332FAC|nr:nuclear transport factor 2 family protein [Streptomyces sp. NBC_01476]
MSTTTPPAVDRYLKAADSRDAQAVADCFTPDGTVLDEGKTYRGRDEIAGWRTALAGQFTYTSTVTGVEEPGEDGEYRLNVRVEGDFPGGVADLRFGFTLRDDRIAALRIV